LSELAILRSSSTTSTFIYARIVAYLAEITLYYASTKRPIYDALATISQSIDVLIEAIKEVLETTPPEVLADVMNRGIYLTGGGALIRGLPEIINEYAKVPVHVALDPLTAVCRGTGIIRENQLKLLNPIIKIRCKPTAVCRQNSRNCRIEKISCSNRSA
jgi:hypothetical protein